MTTATMTAKKFGLTETFFDVESLIRKTVWRFIHTYGGDFEELYAEACSMYIDIYDTFDEDLGAFSTWLYQRVFYGLLDKLRRTASRNASLPREHDTSVVDNAPARQVNNYRLVEIYHDLSDEAKEVCKLVLDLPRTISYEADSRGGTTSCVRGAIRQFLLGAGWVNEQISETFEEIKEALA